MEEKDFDLLVGKVSEQARAAVKTEVLEATQNLASLEDLESKLDQLGLTKDGVKEITTAIEKQGEQLSKMLLGDKDQIKSIDQIIDEKEKDIVKLATDRNAPNVKFKTPLAHKTEVTRAGVSNTTMAMRLPGVGEIPYLGTEIAGLFTRVQVSPSSNGVVRYYDQQAITRSAAPTAESATKPESAITWIERTLNLEKIADSIPVTKEAFMDVGFIRGELFRLLNVNLALEVDEQLWDGNGTSPQLSGIYTTAATFNPATAPDVAAANIYDLVHKVKTNISNNRQSKYMPNGVVMNPVDIERYKLSKGTDGHYVLPPFVSADGMMIAGMRVVESSQVTANTMLVGDFRWGTIYDLEGVSIEMGWVNDQFIQNAMTILAEVRLGLLVRTVDVNAFSKVTDIDAAITAITAS